jgi:hypothetical protein
MGVRTCNQSNWFVWVKTHLIGSVVRDIPFSCSSSRRRSNNRGSRIWSRSSRSRRKTSGASHRVSWLIALIVLSAPSPLLPRATLPLLPGLA